jgi:hydrogenase-4 component B
MNLVWLVIGGVGAMVAAALASLLLARAPGAADSLHRLLVSAGLVAVVGAGVSVLARGSAVSRSVMPTLPGGAWGVLIDPLAAWFLVVLGVVGLATANYGIRYLASERPGRPVAAAHGLVALLLAAMTLVIVARSAVLFLVAWEIMALSAFCLILFEGDQPEVRRAGLIYLVVTHTGTLALISMFLWWGRTSPDLTFQSLAAAAPALPGAGALVLLLALAGFGAKAGVVPLHFWLPGAHAAAPSHVSALLSGVMLKVGVYGLLRVISLAGPGPVWFGWLLVGLGLISGIMGVLWALSQHDLKRVLAYSSVENIGIILLGIGVGALGIRYEHPVVAGLGFLAALLHSLNHGLFKSLLFLAAGAVVHATGTRIIDRMGGVGKRMPVTALAFAVGAIAIVGLPPLNGFVSEWITAVALLRGAATGGLLSLLVVALGGLGLIAALALACFTRLGGALFLGQPRGPLGAVHDDRRLSLPMAPLAVLCLALGALPIVAIQPASRIVPTITGRSADQMAFAALIDPVQAISALATVLAILVLATWLARTAFRRSLRPRTGSTWGCAYVDVTPRMQYTASSFGAALLKAFAPVAGPTEERGSDAFVTRPTDRVLSGVVSPLWSRIQSAAERLRPLQEGRITRYLQYIVLTVLVLLGALMVASGSRP